MMQIYPIRHNVLVRYNVFLLVAEYYSTHSLRKPIGKFYCKNLTSQTKNLAWHAKGSKPSMAQKKKVNPLLVNMSRFYLVSIGFKTKPCAVERSCLLSIANPPLEVVELQKPDKSCEARMYLECISRRWYYYLLATPPQYISGRWNYICWLHLPLSGFGPLSV